MSDARLAGMTNHERAYWEQRVADLEAEAERRGSLMVAAVAVVFALGIVAGMGLMALALALW